jgi:putative membrane protein
MTRLLRAVPAAAGALALGLGGLSPALAATDDGAPQVVNRETVQVELDSSGKLDVARLFSQLTVVGKGTVTIADPVSTKGLRNLDGFTAPDVKDGKAQYTIAVDGTETRRTVSDFTKTLPVSVNVVYTLDGKPMPAKDVVGKTGDLEVQYTVTNVTGEPTDVTWQDGKGVSHTESVVLETPYVGQLATTLPKGYSEIAAPRADAAGDGRGGTLLTWTMVLFDPIGETTQTFGWKGHVEDAVVAPVTIQVIPVPPSKKPELKFGQDGFEDGAAAASELTAGAGQIDANLLKLQSGASDLLAGLTKLAAGAAELRDGLTDKIAPGATALASGAAEAKAGSAELATGLGDADAGASDLADGLAQILAGVKALPGTLAEDPDYQALLGALLDVQAGIGSPTDTVSTTLLGGLNLLKYGLRSPLTPAGCNQLAAPGSATACGAIDAVELVQEKLAAAVAAGGSLDQLVAATQAAYALSGCPAAPAGTSPVAGVLPPTLLTAGTACYYVSTVAFGLGLPAGVDPGNPLGGLKAQTGTASTTLQQVFQGVDASIIPGIGQIKAGLSNPACDLTDPTASANPCGVKEVQGLIASGIGQLVTEISASLSDVLGQASDGADELADGMSLLADGGAQLNGGLGEIADGAGQLSAGLTEAAAGSGELADGLDQAKAGNGQVVDGAGRLRDEGTSKLIEGGNETASDAAEHYATLVALGDKAQDGALPYGAPEGATGSAAYEMTLAGADTSTQDNTRRALVALLVFAAAGAVSWFLHRRLTAR